MEAAAYACGNTKIFRRKATKIYVNGWWREGKHPNVIINVENGNWRDLKTDDQGICRDFADVVFGLKLPAFMERFGPSSTDATRRRWAAQAPKPAPRERAGVGELWERLLAAMPDGRVDGAARWLTNIRGFPVDVAAVVDSGFATAVERQVGLWGDLSRWISGELAWGGLREHGPMIVFPLRDAKTGEVVNLQLRPLRPGKADADARRLLGGCFTRCPVSGAPRGYGFAQAALRADLLVLVEGAVDALAGEAMLRDDLDVVVVGSISSSTLMHWAEWLQGKVRGKCIVVPHIDPPSAEGSKDPGRAGQRASARAVAHLQKHGIPAEMFAWDMFHNALGAGARARVADVADAPRAFGWETARAAFRMSLGVG